MSYIDTFVGSAVEARDADASTSMHGVDPLDFGRNAGTLAAEAADLKVAMVNGSRVFRECLERSLNRHSYRLALTSFADGDDLTLSLEDGARYDLLMLYIGNRRAFEPGVRREIALLKEAGSVPVVVLAESDEIDDIKRVIDAGAQGYIAMSMQLGAVVEALQMVKAGSMFIPASCITTYKRPEHSEAEAEKDGGQAIFTARQAAVVRALRQGMANKRIAYELNMCESTVKVHVRNIMRKLKARNRTEIAFRTHALFVEEDLSAGHVR